MIHSMDFTGWKHLIISSVQYMWGKSIPMIALWYPGFSPDKQSRMELLAY